MAMFEIKRNDKTVFAHSLTNGVRPSACETFVKKDINDTINNYGSCS